MLEISRSEDSTHTSASTRLQFEFCTALWLRHDRNTNPRSAPRSGYLRTQLHSISTQDRQGPNSKTRGASIGSGVSVASKTGEFICASFALPPAAREAKCRACRTKLNADFVHTHTPVLGAQRRCREGEAGARRARNSLVGFEHAPKRPTKDHRTPANQGD